MIKLNLPDLTISDGVTTLIYASAVNVIMSRSIEMVHWDILVAVVIILFIFSDWLSRTWIPLSFTRVIDKERRKKLLFQLMKGLLEIIGVFFLVTASIRILFPLSIPPYGVEMNVQTAFAIFLITSYCWNFMLLAIMEKISWRQLILAAIKGSVFDLEGADEYTKGIKGRVLVAEANLTKEGTLREAKHNTTAFLNHTMLEGFVRTMSQLLAHHLTWVNLVIGVVLLLAGIDIYIEPVFPYGKWVGGTVRAKVLIAILTILIPTGLYVLKKWCEVKLFGILAGIAATVLLIMFYTAFDVIDLVFVMISQQAVLGIFLQFATLGSTGDDTP